MDPDAADEVYRARDQELSRINAAYSAGQISHDVFQALDWEARKKAVEQLEKLDREEELRLISLAESSGRISPDDAAQLKREVREGFPPKLHLTLARLALLPALGIWAASYQPDMLPEWTPVLAFPLLPLWGITCYLARPARTWLAGIGTLVSGPVCILFAGLLEGEVPATFVLLYCVIEVLAIPLGGLVTIISQRTERSGSTRSSLERAKLALGFGAPVLVAAVVIPSAKVHWPGLDWRELVLAAITLFSAVLANARQRTPFVQNVLPPTLRSPAGYLWMSVGFLVLPTAALMIGGAMHLAKA